MLIIVFTLITILIPIEIIFTMFMSFLPKKIRIKLESIYSPFSALPLNLLYKK